MMTLCLLISLYAIRSILFNDYSFHSHRRLFCVIVIVLSFWHHVLTYHLTYAINRIPFLDCLHCSHY